MATCLGPFPLSVTDEGAGAQVRNCGLSLVQESVTVPLNPGAAVRLSPIASEPPGETVGGAPVVPPDGGVIVKTNGTVVTVSKVEPTMSVLLVAEIVVFWPPVNA